MSQAAGQMDASNRKAPEARKRLLALQDFANMGDTSIDWARFKRAYPDFFPTASSGIDRPGYRTLTDWMYAGAADFAEVIRERPDLKSVKPPLLVYRDHLRRVWARNDPNGASLLFVLGFEKEAGAVADEWMKSLLIVHPFIIPGQPLEPEKHTTVAGLPRGEVAINPDTGAIEWKFGCAFQQAVYELMQSRWRSMVCPTCGKYFVAGKTASKYCSKRCYYKMKEKKSLDYYWREGKARRATEAARRKKESRGPKTRRSKQ